ncbi:hypothetical protein ACLIBH_04920 [Virgibacillus sp. W0430]|uniref:hypothetical protein n=1 Tax=Virgibacillus sp. W0430 TaxID=3391580 RepID=UPI003F457EF8
MIRRFRADYIRGDSETGIGIVEMGAHWDNETIAIHSIYVDKRLSNRDASIVIFQRIYNELAEDEGAVLQMNKYSYRKGYDKPYRNRLAVHHIETIRGRVLQANLLAKDAIERKSDIVEVFDESFKFSVVQQEKEERKIND